MTERFPIESTRDDGIELLRYASKLLCLYALCGRRGCRRAQACQGEPRACLPRYAPLVPDDARAGVEAMLRGQQTGLSFEALHAQAPDEIDAIALWTDRVGRSRRRRRRGPA